MLSFIKNLFKSKVIETEEVFIEEVLQVVEKPKRKRKSKS